MTEEAAAPGRTRLSSRAKGVEAAGRLRIGDDWNAITIIALSQDNPLKAVAEFVENSIDAGARTITITITRGRERGEHFLEIADDGRGVPRDADGAPDFRYVATHICDSIKRRLKTGGARGIQGEFGIGLRSFWTVGEELAMSSAGEDGRVHEMRMRKGDPGYTVVRRGSLIAEPGTCLKIRPLLAGVRQLSGDKIQRYLAAPDPGYEVGLYRAGTRILASLASLDAFHKPPWTGAVLQGVPAAGAATGPWDAVVDAGLQFLSRLAEVARLPAVSEQPAADRIDGLEIDPRTGRRYLRLPIPDPDALAKLAAAVGGLLARATKG